MIFRRIYLTKNNVTQPTLKDVSSNGMIIHELQRELSKDCSSLSRELTSNRMIKLSLLIIQNTHTYTHKNQRPQKYANEHC